MINNSEYTFEKSDDLCKSVNCFEPIAPSFLNLLNSDHGVPIAPSLLNLLNSVHGVPITKHGYIIAQAYLPRICML